MRDVRIAALFAALGGAVAAWVTRDLGPAFVMEGAPLSKLCAALAAASAVTVVAPLRVAWVREGLFALVCALRLAIPLVLTLAWTADARELWAALAVWIALHDADRGLVPRAPLAPAALALAYVTAWGSVTPNLAPGRAVLIGLVAGVAAAWGAQHRAGRAPDA